MIFNYFETEKKLLYFEHGVDKIPDEIIEQFSEKDITQLDFSSNSLASLDCISHFTNLKEVIFDNNFLSDATAFSQKQFPNITVLSLNNNKFINLHMLLENLVRCFPNIRYLSLLGNPLCPALLQDFNETDYITYRLAIISRMPKLKFLDAKQVDKKEKMLVMQTSNSHEVHHSTTENPRKKMEKFGSIKKFFGFSSRESPSGESAMDKRKAYSPLPSDNLDNCQSSPKSAYGKVKSIYEGSQSQGNRFIMNQDL